MKTKLIYLSMALALTAAPLAAVAADEGKSPGKDSTTTTVPAPPTPPATDPAESKGAAGVDKTPGKESTSTAVPKPPMKEEPAK